MLARQDRNLQELDQRILALAAAGARREAGALLIEVYGAEILGTCVARTGDPAIGEDAAQDALARALVALADYRGQGGLRPWLHRIAANRCIDLLRSRRSTRLRTIDDYAFETLPAPEAPLPSEAAAMEVERKARIATIRAALAQIKEPDRTWVELHYTHGVSYDDLADQHELSRAAVKQRIWRAVKRVRELLGDQEDGA